MRLASVRAPVAFDVDPGDVVLLRGPNGSGKTSVLRALAGLASARPVACDARAATAFAPQDARDALVGLTVASEFRLRRRQTPGALAPLAARPSAELSSGEARRVVLATVDGAPLLLLDEPAEGLDAEGRARLRALVEAARRRGAVVAADHGRAFEGISTKVVDLAPTTDAPLPSMPRADGSPILVAPAITLRGVVLPAIELGPGFHVLRGPNGSGKSTLLLRLAGLLEPHGVAIHGRAPAAGSDVRLLLPHAGDLLTRERVADECPPHPLVPDALRGRHPLAISGGEAQRVALAKTLGAPAPVYLLDEPEAHLDADARVLLVEAIAARVKDGACVLVATHDEVIAALAQTSIEVGS